MNNTDYFCSSSSLGDFIVILVYLLIIGNSISRWYQKIGRKDAEKLIMNSANPFGTFLIRSSETAEGLKTMD